MSVIVTLADAGPSKTISHAGDVLNQDVDPCTIHELPSAAEAWLNTYVQLLCAAFFQGTVT